MNSNFSRRLMPATACVLSFLLLQSSSADIPWKILVPHTALHGKNHAPDIVRLKDGRLFLAFMDGHHHWSLPTPIRDHLSRLYFENLNFEVTEDVDRPLGSRWMGMWSNDDGHTWSKPIPIIDRPGTEGDVHLTVLRDGTLVAMGRFQSTGEDQYWQVHPKPYVFPTAARLDERNRTHDDTTYMSLHTSTDGGKTWSEMRRVPNLLDEVQGTSGKLAELANGDWVVSHWGNHRGSDCAAVIASTDRGRTWTLRSVIDGPLILDEAGLLLLRDGRLLASFRPAAHIIFASDDGGRNWYELVQGNNDGKQEWPDLYEMRNGKVLLYGGGGNPRISWTADLKKWYGPFQIARSGNSKLRAVELPDGTMFCVWHNEMGRRHAEIRIARVRIRKDGLDVLPP